MQKKLYQAQSVLKKSKEDDPRGSNIPNFHMAQAEVKKWLEHEELFWR